MSPNYGRIDKSIGQITLPPEPITGPSPAYREFLEHEIRQRTVEKPLVEELFKQYTPPNLDVISDSEWLKENTHMEIFFLDNGISMSYNGKTRVLQYDSDEPYEWGSKEYQRIGENVAKLLGLGNKV